MEPERHKSLKGLGETTHPKVTKNHDIPNYKFCSIEVPTTAKHLFGISRIFEFAFNLRNMQCKTPNMFSRRLNQLK